MTRTIPGLALAALLLLGLTEPAYAGKGDETAAVLFGPAVLAWLVFPIGLALHLLLLGFTPRRGLSLVHRVERHRGKTIALGVLNTGFLLFFAMATGKPAPFLSALALILWSMLALVGSFGIARALGARILGHDHPAEAPTDVKELAVGWFAMVFVVGFPLLGPLVGLYWAMRATGGVILTLLAVEESGEKAFDLPPPLPDPQPPAVDAT